MKYYYEPENDLNNEIDERWFRIPDSIVRAEYGENLKSLVGKKFLFEYMNMLLGKRMWKLRKERSGLKDDWRIPESLLEPI